MISGGIMVFVWRYMVRPLGGFWDIYELLPAFLVAVLCIVVFSLATGKPEEDTIKTFHKVSAVCREK